MAASGVPVPRADDVPTAVVDAGGGPGPRTRIGPGGQPPPRGPQGPEQPARTARPAWLPWAVAAVAGALVVALVVLLLRADGRADDAVADAQEAAGRLLALTLPEGADPTDCTDVDPADGELRVLRCPAGDGDGAAPAGTYTAYGPGEADARFDAVVEQYGLRQLDDVFDCGGLDTPRGWAEVRTFDDELLGRLSCVVDDEGDAELRWTWDDLGTMGLVELRGGGDGGLDDLESWWGRSADRGL
jgi:hypothetical protein